jgi:hypothetical protein
LEKCLAEKKGKGTRWQRTSGRSVCGKTGIRRRDNFSYTYLVSYLNNLKMNLKDFLFL